MKVHGHSRKKEKNTICYPGVDCGEPETGLNVNLLQRIQHTTSLLPWNKSALIQATHYVQETSLSPVRVTVNGPEAYQYAVS